MAAFEESSEIIKVDEDLKRIIDPNNLVHEITTDLTTLQSDPDYLEKGGISLEQYYEKRTLWMKAYREWGADPLFTTIMGVYDYANAIQFLKVSDMITVCERTPQSEIIDITFRNTEIGNIYKRMKKRAKDIKILIEKNIPVNIIDNGRRERTTSETTDE
jgi:hypothetical protein